MEEADHFAYWQTLDLDAYNDSKVGRIKLRGQMMVFDDGVGQSKTGITDLYHLMMAASSMMVKAEKDFVVLDLTFDLCEKIPKEKSVGMCMKTHRKIKIFQKKARDSKDRRNSKKAGHSRKNQRNSKKSKHSPNSACYVQNSDICCGAKEKYSILPHRILPLTITVINTILSILKFLIMECVFESRL